MAAPEFGISISFQCHRGLGERWDRVYGEALELAAEAGRLGIDSIWVSEHHGEADGYCPSPIVAGAALATAAKTARVGQGIAVAPLYGHPMRLIEDLAVLDNLTAGKLEIGLGQGYRPAEFEAWGLNYRTRTRAFEECLSILALAWSGEPFDFDGDIYTVKGGLLRPTPVVPGPAPLWIGAAAPVSRARAVRNGAGLIIAPLVELGHAARQFGAFDMESAAQGKGRLPHALMREVLLGDGVADAMARQQASLDLIYRQQYAPERTGLTVLDRETGERRAVTSDDPDYLSEGFVSSRWFAGTPDTVRAGIAEWAPKLGLDRLVWQPKPPGMPLRQAIDDLEIMAREVIGPLRAAA
ncbi:MAG: LLM class flavin-dependent oxidoreductase [Pseudomonadota bacterium]|nr:LLM class flavin-dependent oxidoreductase [Pseudomonadota bacterium]